MGFCMDGVFGYGNNVSLIFRLEFEWTPLQAVSDEIPPYAGRFLLCAFHFDDERMDLMMLAVIRNNVDDRLCIRLDKDLFFECSLFHADDYTVE